MKGVMDRLEAIDDKVQGIDDEVQGIDEKLDGTNRSSFVISWLSYFSFRMLRSVRRKPNPRWSPTLAFPFIPIHES